MREKEEDMNNIQPFSHTIPEEEEKGEVIVERYVERKRREEKKPYPDSEKVFPLGGHPLLASTTPISDSFIQ